METYCVNAEQLNKIQVKLLKCTETNNPFNLQKKEGINNIIDCLQPSFLQQSISKNCKAITKIITFIKAIDNQKNEKNEGYIENLKQNLQVWALQYLSKGAKIPILEQKGPLQIPFFEYYGSNSLEYYRHDGGEIEKIIVDKLKKHELEVEGEDDNFYLILTKLNTFSLMCDIVCESEKYHRKKIASKKKLKTAIENIETTKENIFYDITPLLLKNKDIKKVFGTELISVCEKNKQVIIF